MKKPSITVAVLINFVVICVMIYPLAKVRIRASRLKKSTVMLITPTQATGSGSVIEIYGKRFILTNAHVCGETHMFNLVRYKGKDIGLFDVVYRDIVLDLCLLKAPENIPSISISSSAKLGEEVVTAGHPHSGPLMTFTGVLVHEQRVSLNSGKPPSACHPPFVMQFNFFYGPMCVIYMDIIFSTLFTSPGQSGSPVVNMRGNLVGVVVSTGGGTIPLKNIKRFISSAGISLKLGGSVGPKPYAP